MKPLLLAAAVLILATPALATSEKVTICHATGSGFVQISPSASGVVHGHIEHQHGRDIIPPFEFRGETYSQNWPAGQTVWEAGCRTTSPSPTTTPSPSVGPTPSVSPSPTLSPTPSPSPSPNPEPKVITPRAPRFTDPTCPDPTGSVVLPRQPGVVFDFEGDVGPGENAEVIAIAKRGFVFAEGAVTRWTHDYARVPANCGGESPSVEPAPGTAFTGNDRVVIWLAYAALALVILGAAIFTWLRRER